MKPTIPILNPAFRYTNSANTDLHKTFARIRREQAQMDKARKEQEEREKVTPIKRAAK